MAVWTELIGVESGTERIDVTVSYEAAMGEKPYTLFDGEMVPLDPSFTLTVPVEWKDGGRGVKIPHTRQKGVDNADVVLVTPTGNIAAAQVAITTRKGRFYLSIQEIYDIQAIRQDGEVEFFPARAVHAYPGADFSRTFQSAALRLTELLADAELPTEAPEITWDPPQVEPRHPWETGAVKWFNLVTGMGLIAGSDGVDTRVHFSKVEGEGPFRVLAPMTGVYWKQDSDQSGNCRQARLVRAAS
ncbi:MAG: cold shock domain-containing protein [bacterium]|nr:cold shock domain-containing protein [bacterium]